MMRDACLVYRMHENEAIVIVDRKRTCYYQLLMKLWKLLDEIWIHLVNLKQIIPRHDHGLEYPCSRPPKALARFFYHPRAVNNFHAPSMWIGLIPLLIKD